MDNILIYGAGGHSKVTVDLLKQLGNYNIRGLLDDNAALHGSNCLDYEILGGFELLKSHDYRDCKIAIGVAKPDIRRKIFDKVNSLGYEFVTLVHPSAYLGYQAKIGPASTIMPHAVIHTKAEIGTGVVVNTAAIVEHECVIHDFVHVAPGVHLSGAVEVGKGALLGIGATVIEFVKIGENAVVGAGAVVVKDVPARSVVVGNPAQILKEDQ
jgi:sugar O-acyltransferase (sialic acid O-acetyltransferase NeuD family)